MTKRSACLLLLIAGLVVLGACGGSPPEDAPKTAPAASGPPKPQYSYAQMNDLRVAPQLGTGWYSVEEGSWRWMAKEAQLNLRAPDSATPQFEVRFSLPKGQVSSLGAMKLAVLFNDKPFAEENYTADGDYTLTKAVPAGTLTPQEAVRVTLRWSKARPPNSNPGGDLRELAAVVVGVGFK